MSDIDRFLTRHELGDLNCSGCSELAHKEKCDEDGCNGMLHMEFEGENSGGGYQFSWCCDQCGYNNIGENRARMLRGNEEIIRAKIVPPTQ